MKPLSLGLVALLIAIAATAGTTPVAAQGTAQKVAFLNLRNILQQTPGYAKAESTFTQEIEGFRVEVAKLQGSLDSAATDFEQSSVLLSPTSRAAKRKDLEAQRDKLDQRTAELRDRAAGRERELLDPIQARVNAVIDGIRAEGNYSIIFDVGAQGNGIVSADKGLDLTDKVVQRLKASK